MGALRAVGRDLEDRLVDLTRVSDPGHPVALALPQIGDIPLVGVADIAGVGAGEQHPAALQSLNGPGQSQGRLPGHGGPGQDGGGLLRAGTVKDSAVFAQEADRVGHRGEQPPQGVILPPGGRAEQDAPVPQPPDESEKGGVQGGGAIGDERAVNIAGDEPDHTMTSVPGDRKTAGARPPPRSPGGPDGEGPLGDDSAVLTAK